MKKLVIATSNQGKLKEIRHYFSDFNLTIHSQDEFSIEAVPETGQTFLENAIIKARHACKVTQLPALADDSGLVISALNGEPGIYSARYAGEPTDNAANNEKVILKMQDIAVPQRQAYFYCAMVLMLHEHDPAPLVSTGTWQGRILNEPSGEKGFGYDPIFYVPEYDCAAAELDLAVKNKVSHRGQALKQIVKQFHDILR